MNGNELFFPFKTMDNMLIAMQIYKKLKHYEDNNINVISELIKLKTGQLDLNEIELKNFFEKIKFCSKLYPTQFFNEYDKKNQFIEEYITRKKLSIIEFVPIINTCQFCHKSLANSVIYKINDAVHYSASKAVQQCIHSYIKCEFCSCAHFYSYYITKEKVKRFYLDSLKKKVLSFTNRSFFDRKLFDMVIADIHYKHSSFKGFCGAYNAIFSNKLLKRGQLIPHRLRESWFFYHLVKFNLEFNQNMNNYPTRMDHLDKEIAKIRNSLLFLFVNKWSGPFHTSHCKHPKCMLLQNVDGNWKTTRLRCGFENIYIESDEIKQIKIG